MNHESRIMNPAAAEDEQLALSRVGDWIIDQHGEIHSHAKARGDDQDLTRMLLDSQSSAVKTTDRVLVSVLGDEEWDAITAAGLAEHVPARETFTIGAE